MKVSDSLKFFVVFLILLVTPLFVEGASETISFDGFESGGFCGGLNWEDCWEKSVSDTIIIDRAEGTYGLKIGADKIVSREMDSTTDFSKYSEIDVSFFRKSVNFNDGAGGSMTVKLYMDGILAYTNTFTDSTGWTQENFIVENTATSSMSIEFSFDYNGGSEAYIDSVNLSGVVEDNPEVTLSMLDSYVVGTDDAVITLSSSETDVLHTLELRDENNETFCTKNLMSPSIANTIFSASCDIPDRQIIDAKAYFYATNQPEIRSEKLFNVVELSADDTKIDIDEVYFSPQVLQGGSTEVFAVVDRALNVNLSRLYLELTYPDGTYRRLGMEPTVNNGEYRAFITDTYRTGMTSFRITAESDEHFDTYENSYEVVPYNLPTLEHYGTQYEAGDEGKTFIQLLDGNSQPINDSLCYVSMYYPFDVNGDRYFTNQLMTYEDEGLYYYNFQVPFRRGIYMLSSYCVVDRTGVIQRNVTDDFEDNAIDGGSGWDSDWDLDGATIDGFNSYQGAYKLGVEDGENPERDIAVNSSDDEITVNVFYRLSNFEADDEMDILIIDSSGTEHLVRTVTDAEDDYTWRQASKTFNVADDGFNFSDIVTFKIDTAGATGGDFIDIDVIDITIRDEFVRNSTEYQFVRGSGEVQVVSDLLYEATFNRGELFNKSFFENFHLHFDVESRVAQPTNDVKVTLETYEGFPCRYVDSLTVYNGSTYLYNITDYNIGNEEIDKNSCEVTFEFDFEPDEIYDIAIVARNFWKQEVLSDYQDLILLNNFLEIGCTSYQESMGYDDFVVPLTDISNSSVVYTNDTFYRSCYGFFNSFFQYNDTVSDTFFPLLFDAQNFSLTEMNQYEADLLTLRRIGSDVDKYAKSIIQGLNLANAFSESILEDPYSPENPSYALYFANISSNNLIYEQILSLNSSIQNQEIFDILDDINSTTNSTGSYLRDVIYDMLDEINQSNNDIYSYLQNIIYPEIDETEEKLDAVLVNTSNIWDKLEDIENGVDINTVKLENLSSLVSSVNTSIIAEIDENEARLIMIKNVVDSIAFEINETVVPRLYNIGGNVTLIQGNLTDIISYTQNLDGNQQEILADIDAINTTIENIDDKNDIIISNLGSLNTTILSEFATLQTNISGLYDTIDNTEYNDTILQEKIDNLTIISDDINTTVYGIDTYLKNEIQQNLSSLYTVLSNVNLTVNGIDSYLQNTIYPEIDTVEEDVASLRQNMTDNFGFIFSELNGIDTNISDLDGQLIVIESLLTGVNQSIIDEVINNRNRIDSMNTNVTYIRDYLELHIPTIKNSLLALNTTLEDIDEYQKTAIFTLLQDINQTNYDIYAYLQTVLYPKIDGVENNTEDLLINVSDIFTDFENVTAEIQVNRNQLIILKSLVNATNQSIIDEVNENEAHLVIIDSVLDSVATDINDTVVPSLTGIENNLTVARSDISTILSYTDTLEAGQQDIKFDLGNISVDIESLNSSVDAVNQNLFTANESIHVRFDTLQTNVSDILASIGNIETYNDSQLITKLDELNTTLLQVNTTLASLDSYVRNDLQDDIDYIKTVVDAINLTVDGIDTYLVNTIYPEIDQTEELLGDVLNNHTTIWNKLLEIDGQAETNTNILNLLDTAIVSVNDTVKNVGEDITTNLTVEINENEAKLDSIITTTNNIETRILTVVEPALTSISGNLTNISAEISIVKDYVDTLEIVQTEIINRLGEINSSIDSNNDDVIARLDEINITLNSSQAELISRFDELNISLDEVQTSLSDIKSSLSSVNQSIISNIEFANDSLHDRFDIIENDISNLNITQNTQQILDELEYVDMNISVLHQKLDCTYSNNALCDKIDTLNDSVFVLNTTMNDVQGYLEGTVTNYLININTTVEDIYPYLTDVIYPKINTTEEYVLEILEKQNLTLDNINLINGNLTQNYNVMLDTQNLIYLSNMSLHDLMLSVNQTIVDEVNANEIYLEDINDTTAITLNLLNTVIIPQLDDIENNISFVSSQVSNITFNMSDIEQDIYDMYLTLNESTDETQDLIREVNASILLHVGLINQSLYDEIIIVQDYVDSLENGQTAIINDFDEFYADMNISFDTTYDLIRNTNETLLNQLQTTNLTLYNELQTIKSYVDTLENGQQNILDNLDDMYAQMNISFDTTFSLIENTNTTILYRLGLINDSLYNELQIIKSDIDSVQVNMTDLEELVLELYGDMNSSFSNTYARIDNVNATLLLELGEINQSLYDEIITVQNLVDTLESGQAQIQSDLLDMHGQMNTSFDTTYEFIENVNATLLNELGIINTSLYDEIIIVQDYVDTLESGQSDILAYIDDMYTQMNISFNDTLSAISGLNTSLLYEIGAINDSLYNEISVVQSYTDSLETGQQNILEYINFSESRIISNITFESSEIQNDIVTAELNILTDIDDLEQNVLESINASEDRILTNVSLVIDGAEQNVLTNISFSLSDLEEYIISELNQSIIENRQNLSQELQNIDANIIASLNDTRLQVLDAINITELNIIENLNATEQKIYNNMTRINDNLLYLNESCAELITDFESLNFTVTNEFIDLEQDIIDILDLIDTTAVNLSCSEDASEICGLLDDIQHDVLFVNESVYNLNTTVSIGNYTDYFEDINGTVFDIKDYQQNLMYPSIIEYFEEQTIVTLTNMHRVVINNDYEIELTTYNPYLDEISPDSEPEITITDSTGTEVVSDIDMVEISDGIFKFNYSISSSANPGIWTTSVRVIIDGQEQVVFDKWNVISNPTQVEIEAQSLCGIEVCGTLTITNEGSTAYEYVYNYWTTDDPFANYEDDAVTDRGQASKLLQPGETFTTEVCMDRPQTSNTHYLRARTFYGEYSFATDSFTNTLQCREIDRGVFTGRVVDDVTDILEGSPFGIALGIMSMFLLFVFARSPKWENIRRNDEESPYEIWINHPSETLMFLEKIDDEKVKVELTRIDEDKRYEKGERIFVHIFNTRDDARIFMKDYRKDYPDGPSQ